MAKYVVVGDPWSTQSSFNVKVVNDRSSMKRVASMDNTPDNFKLFKKIARGSTINVVSVRSKSQGKEKSQLVIKGIY